MTQAVDTLPMPLSKRLKAHTGTVHDRLDKRIMAGNPFADRARYGRFLAVQYLFHRDVDPLYANPALEALLPDLDGRRRLRLIGQDITDIGGTLPDTTTAPAFDGAAIDLPTALGWLYVAEGSNLGAAFLYKAAAALGLDDRLGARHLAGHPDGRAQHWRQFTTVLDSLEFTTGEEARLLAGATAAFERVHALVEARFG